MEPSEVVGERFEVESLAGAGGMGRVYKARDRLTGETVALKVLHGKWDHAVERFDREATTLAALSHPRIVRHVDHGTTPGGEPYLAMEWLEGEELAARIARAPLKLDESVRLTALVGETLAAAHSHGVIHRDIKPSNLFLVGGDVERVKILDFGLARRGVAASEISRSGVMLGTPAYMSPEQARLDKKLDFRTDLFSLGCVLFKCLTGRLPFVGENLVAILAKVMLEPAPRVDSLRPDVPPLVAELVADLLEKEPANRPVDGLAVSARIAALGPLTQAEGVPPSIRPPSLTAEERRIVSVVLARRVTDPAPAVTEGGGRTDTFAETIVQTRSVYPALQSAVERYGARVTLLADGSAVVAIAAKGAATDQADRAARCAIALRSVSADAQIALAIGRTDADAVEGLGQVIDRAAHLLRGPATSPESLAIRLDESTAGLLDARFEVETDERGLWLGSERPARGATRTLLGKATPFVGRARELRTLEAVFDECVTEPVARVILVTAPSGVGKSRLRYEFVSKIESQTKDVDVQVWIGRGDPMSAGSPFGILAPLLRRVAGIQDGERLEARQSKLAARVGDGRVREFLGEIIGTPFPDEASVQLRSARRDPTLMGDQMRRAWEDFVLAECGKGPLVIVLEDLHWGDLPTVSFIDAALRNVGEAPLMVLALARPEIVDLFPRLWSERGLVPLPLGELGPKAAEKLARAALGDDADSEIVRHAVERAGGNAFFLEEILRHVASGAGGALPDTVLAMVGARLESLEPEARRVLRAASLFGQVFWRGGVLALLGGGDDKTLAGEWLGELAQREMVTARADSKFEGEREFVFHHAFVRDAAYAMLTDHDVELGHRLAATWLARAGETDAMVLAEHFLRGGDPKSAIDWYVRAAAQALAANDYDGVLLRASKGEEAGAEGETLGEIRLLEAEASRWRGHHADVGRFGAEALSLLPRGSAAWCAAVGELASARHRLGDLAGLDALAEALLELSPPFEAHHLIVAFRLATSLLFAGLSPRSLALAAHAEALANREALGDPAAAARVELYRGARAMFSGSPVEYLVWMRAAAESFERAGDARSACTPRANAGFAYIEIGEFEKAEAELRAVIARASRMGLTDVLASARHNLGLALGRQGRFEEGRREEIAALAVFETGSYRRMVAASRIALAEIELAAGELDRALLEAEKAVEAAEPTPPMRVYALALAASVLLLQGRIEEARRPALLAAELLESLGSLEAGESLVNAVYAETLRASGEHEAARAVIAKARAELEARAMKIDDPVLRRSFLERVPDNARVLARAAEWGVVSAPRGWP